MTTSIAPALIAAMSGLLSSVGPCEDSSGRRENSRCFGKYWSMVDQLYRSVSLLRFQTEEIDGTFSSDSPFGGRKWAQLHVIKERLPYSGGR